MDIFTFAVEVARHLSEARQFAWHARPSPYDHMRERHAEIFRMDGASLALNIDHRSKTRVTVKAKFPAGHHPWGVIETVPVYRVSEGSGSTVKTRDVYGEIPFTCTVAMTRDPKGAAAYIVRSLLARYEEAFPKSAREAAVEKRDQEDQDRFSKAVLEAGGQPPELKTNSGPWQCSRVHACGLSVEPRKDDMCEVRGDIPRDLALGLMRELRARYGTPEAEAEADEDDPEPASGGVEAAE
jgi:hypothetical protein